MEKILIIKHGALGDVVLAMGTLQAIRREHPEAELWLLTAKGFFPIAQAMGIFTGCLEDNRRGKVETLRVLRGIARGGFTDIYDFQQSQRARFYRRVLRFLWPRGVYRWVDTKTQQLITITKKCSWGVGRAQVQAAHIPWEKTDLSGMRAEGKHFDMLPQRYVLFIPGCSAKHTYKRWPVERYGELADRLGRMGISVVVLGTRDEAAEGEAIARGRDWVVNMVGLTSLTDVPQVALRSLAVVGNDTGPTHMAAMTGRFTIGLFDHRNARSVLRGDHVANLVSPGGVELIGVEEVWEKLDIYDLRFTIYDLEI